MWAFLSGHPKNKEFPCAYFTPFMKKSSRLLIDGSIAMVSAVDKIEITIAESFPLLSLVMSLGTSKSAVTPANLSKLRTVMEKRDIWAPVVLIIPMTRQVSLVIQSRCFQQ